MSFPLPQTATYWEPLGNNGTGGITWGAGVKLDARIADIDTIVYTAEGKSRHATKAFYTTVTIPNGSKVIEGDFGGDAAPDSAAQLIIKSSRNTSSTNMNRAVV